MASEIKNKMGHNTGPSPGGKGNVDIRTHAIKDQQSGGCC